MGTPDLKLVDSDENPRCGMPTADGSPCERQTDGSPCWQHGGTSTGDLPDPPDHLGQFGRECWYYQVRDCMELGVLDQVDLTMIEQAAEVYQMKRLAFEASKRGPTIEGRGGKPKKNPAVSKFNDFSTEYRQCVKELARLKAAAEPRRSGDDGIGQWL